MLVCDRYEVSCDMHAGGMSEAHRCRDIRLERDVILKTLQTEQEIRRLEDERKALLKIRSNHVVQLLDIAEVQTQNGKMQFLVLEFIDGTDLDERMFDVDSQYLSILWQIAKGLSEIHKGGVIHRDIKPNNVRLDREGVVKIIDFGLSRVAGTDNKTMAAIGYLPYMAPELLSSPPIHFTTATDVYSFGVLALAITKHGLPSAFNSWAKSIPNDLVETHLPTLDKDLADILQSCLENNPSDRPTMAEIVATLDRVLLRGRHKARVVIGGKANEISSTSPIARPRVLLNGSVVSQLDIRYTGSEFKVEKVVGVVNVNNKSAAVGMVLPDSCVLAFEGKPNVFSYATFDVSNPEFIP